MSLYHPPGNALVKLSSAFDCRLSFLLIGCLLTEPGLVPSATLASAAEQEPARRHSLIHRQDSGSPTDASGSSAPASPPPATTTTHPLHRKLTKRPGLATITPPSNSSQAGASVPQSPSTRLTATASGERRISTEGNTLSSQASIPVTTGIPLPQAMAGTTGATVPLAGATLSTAKPSASSAFAAAGTGAAASSGVNATSGRGLQRLTGQMPGLTRLLAPAVSVSSPPPSPSQSSPPSSPPSSAPPVTPPPPPGTGSATLSWTLSSESDLAGYKIYVGTAPGLYNYPGSPIAIGLANSYTVTGLPYGQTYYFAISAYNYSGGESELSGEVSKSIY